nr:putative reverse transcriptase domain-containing protein [Tanacetum cinerariifolium]
MDWLSNHKAEIICHEKVVKIAIPDDKVLRVIGERPKEKMRHLVSDKAKEQKREELVVVRYFPEIRRMVVAMETKTIQSVVLKVGVLIDEAIRNGSIKKNPEKRGNRGKHSKDRNVRDDNKRLKNDQEKDKIGSKSDKNGKRGEAKKCQK